MPSLTEPAAAAASEFTDLEFHRRGLALPVAGEEGLPPAAAVLVPRNDPAAPLLSCSCGGSGEGPCRHLERLRRLAARWEACQEGEARSWEERFHASRWYRLAQALFAEVLPDLRLVALAGGLAVRTATGGEWLWLPVAGGQPDPAGRRLLERLGLRPDPAGEPGVGNLRAEALARLRLFQATDDERRLNKAGVKTARQKLEESPWHALAYHGLREYGAEGSLHPLVEEVSGELFLEFRDGSGRAALRIAVPRERVAAVLAQLAREAPDQPDLHLRPVPMEALLKATEETQFETGDAAAGESPWPKVDLLQQRVRQGFLGSAAARKLRYGRWIFLPALGILAELERPGKERRFKTPPRLNLAAARVATFRQSPEVPTEAAEAPQATLAATTSERRILKGYDALELEPLETEPLEGDKGFFHLRVRYRPAVPSTGAPGNESPWVDLADLLSARRRQLPYLETTAGWLDLSAGPFRFLDLLLARRERPESSGIALAPAEVLLLTARAAEEGAAVKRRPAEEGPAAQALAALLELRPRKPFEPPAALATSLRPYQVLGVEWLLFLQQHGLSGLLCDDMGLGKTHQAMALLAVLAAEDAGPLLVVCPRTVLSHWRDKLQRFAPGLRTAVHHGAKRNLDDALYVGQVVVTSYGVLLQDAARLARRRYALVVFDEVQQLKNRGTKTYRAAAMLPAAMKLGLTGTPIENDLGELHALFDLVLPGYLGSEDDFRQRYGAVASTPRAAEPALRHLRGRIGPFVLRRLKAAVLDELPAKIEDLRTCTLSDEQLSLYRDLLRRRGSVLRQRLGAGESGVFLHVFRLLLELKRICDHPALVHDGGLERYEAFESGKWDLYQELLSEALDSGQKVVVFSQFLGMLAILERDLESRGVGFVKLTGSSRHRGRLIRRFNEDPDCRVFLGSLQAGGTGIDLVGGSVVIHYDRWWTAAREDQATDRVYRMGQKRAVQVFKLVTEGTLEEKISAMIERKRELLEAVVVPDEPALGKVFSRGELMELLEPI